MARMIPSVLSPEIKSNAEKHIFEWFKDAPETENWIVLHSLGISNHNRVIHGETDFFVLAPGKGLFAIEVKGGRVIREDGLWKYTDKYNESTVKTRGPFDQAWEGIFSIIEDVKSKLDDSHSYLKDVFFGIGVMFPDIEYETVGCDEEQWQVFDCNDGNRVKDYVNRIFDGACNKWERIYNIPLPESKLPTVEDINYLASILRGDFDKAVALSVQLRNSEDELIKLTNEQYRCLDQLDDNKRCLITGGAGTGKTLLAVEEAKKAVARGEKTVLLCFNRLLGDWLEHYFSNNPEELRPFFVGTFHKFMIQSVKSQNVRLNIPINEEEQKYYFSHELPQIAKRVFRDWNVKVDKIIIDEAQDLITDEYLSVIDMALKKGLERGKWTFFGDFSKQSIYENVISGSELIEKIDEKSSFIRFKLTVNCRNTRLICEEITLLTGFEPPSDIWSKVDGIPVQYYTYSDRDEEKERICVLIRSLLDNHISPSSITILSPVKRENSIIDCIDEFEIKDFKPYKNNRLAFSTIQSFKGLDNTVIILTDIETISDTKLMYVALSRARAGLYVIESENAHMEYINLQRRRLSNG